jgi:hypothetical protein
MKYHPQVLSEFEDEMPKLWGKRWKANTTIGKLQTVLLHRPGFGWFPPYPQDVLARFI